MDELVSSERPSLIIQARMGSSRLPGKVTKILEGKTILEHFIDRVKLIDNIDKIIVATTTSDIDDVIIDTIGGLDDGILTFRGSENDVLDRFYQASNEYDVSSIVRLTPDNPLVDPEVSGKVVMKYLEGDWDYCCNNMPRTYPLGLDTEVFSFDSLESAWNKATTPYQREHVTPYIREHPGMFKMANVSNGVDYSGYRWTMDYPQDFNFVKNIYKLLYNKNEHFKMMDVINLIQENKWLMELNRIEKEA